MATKSQIPDSASRAFALELQQLRADVDALQRSLRAAQLGHATIDNGQLAFKDPSGTVRGTLGINADGTFSQVSSNAPPPPQPSVPQVASIAAGASITWDGVFASGAAKPLDFAFIEIHVGGADNFTPSPATAVGTLSEAGTWIHAPLDSGNIYYVGFIAVNTSNSRSPISTLVPMQPLQVVAQEVLDGIITEVKLANGAVSTAKIALQAVGSGQIAGNSISTAQLQDGSVQASKILDGAVQSGKISANAVGANEIAANAIVAGKIAANAVTTNTIAANAIDAGKIAASAISADKIAANAVTAEKINALAVTTDKIAANAINAGHITAGAVTAAKLAATLVLASTIVAGNPTGARIQLDSGGIEGYRANGTKSLDFDTATGNMTVAGIYRSGDTGERIQINVDGTQDFFNSSGATSGKIENNGTSGLTFRGSASDYYLEMTGSRIGLWSGPKTGTRDAQHSVNDRNIDTRAPVIGLRVSEQFSSPDGVERRVVFIQTNSSGSDRSDSIIHYYRRSVGNPLFIRPGNSGIVFDNAALAVVDGSGTSHGPIVASAFSPPSSQQLKEHIGEIEVPNERTSWDIIEGAPALDWKYISERPEARGDKPRDHEGNPIKLRQRRVDINGIPLPDIHPDAWEYVEAEFDAPPKPRRKHRFPLAEDLFEMDSELVEGTPNDPERMTVDLRDMVGLLWDAVDMLIKRNRVLEQKLTNRFPNLDIPARPQKGDVTEGVGTLILGRTRRVIDSATGQISNRNRNRNP